MLFGEIRYSILLTLYNLKIRDLIKLVKRGEKLKIDIAFDGQPYLMMK